MGRKGYELAFSEAVLPGNWKMERKRFIPARMIDGDVNLGVILGEMQLMFSYQDGGLVSLKRKDGIQWMIRPPVPVYWRASTDNDRGNGFAKESRLWLAKTLFPEICKGKAEIRETDKEAELTFTWEDTTVTYRMRKDGMLGVRAHFHGKKGYPSLPVFGLAFELPEQVSRFPGMEEGRGRIILTAGPEQGWEFTKAQKRAACPVFKASGMRDAYGYPEVGSGNKRRRETFV